MYQEYERLQKKLEKVNDPQYAGELRRKQIDLDTRIKTLTKEFKLLQIEQIRREKRLDKIIQQGEPEILKNLQH